MDEGNPTAITATSRVGRRRLRTRAALVSGARALFASQGVGSTTIQGITEAADVAKGGFYNYFDSKEDILRAVADETLAELARALEVLTEPMRDDPARVVAVCLRHTLRACVENPTLGWFVLRAGETIALGDAALGAYGRRDLRRGIDSGRFTFDDMELAVTMIAGGAEALLRRRLNGELGAEADIAFTTHVLRLLGVPDAEASAVANETLATLRDLGTNQAASSPNDAKANENPAALRNSNAGGPKTS